MADGRRCPHGTELMGVCAPPTGQEQWCQRMTDDRNLVKDRPHLIWYENGQKYEEGEFKNGKREGRWMRWYENGQKKERELRNGKIVQ